jgi:hypothetical protein
MYNMELLTTYCFIPISNSTSTRKRLDCSHLWSISFVFSSIESVHTIGPGKNITLIARVREENAASSLDIQTAACRPFIVA